jgi:hypothetical protein
VECRVFVFAANVDTQKSASRSLQTGLRRAAGAERAALGSHADEKHHEYGQQTDAHNRGYGQGKDYSVHDFSLRSRWESSAVETYSADFSDISMISA